MLTDLVIGIGFALAMIIVSIAAIVLFCFGIVVAFALADAGVQFLDDLSLRR